MKRMLLFVLLCLWLPSAAHANLILVVDSINKTLSVQGSDSGTAGLEDGVGQVAWNVNPGPGGDFLFDNWTLIDSTSPLTGGSFSVGASSGELFFRIQHELPLTPITLTGNKTTISYASLPAESQAFLESFVGSDIPHDTYRGTGFGPMLVRSIDDPLPVTETSWGKVRALYR